MTNIALAILSVTCETNCALEKVHHGGLRGRWIQSAGLGPRSPTERLTAIRRAAGHANAADPMEGPQGPKTRPQHDAWEKQRYIQFLYGRTRGVAIRLDEVADNVIVFIAGPFDV